ncbi:SIR2 family protein [Clostridium perfringens]|uniref:SIR2 family protein n=2 Tax=Clostridium perfringens TaxID=1502 RepID=UPI00244B71A9|nr:SIR2 family protein [Clostridium perfringens]MDH2474371.1 SIR2 family protein [Clostridium perfringens]MDK0850182.1 SIR2 family protein [Clostridium perfringens]MDM0545216.1 SIR2 family protein [Clostridium perfringens]MDM0556864.1 SIR2 family protein [Clostridium perfringens]
MEAFSNESKRIINKAARNNKLVVFVGAGVSMNSGYPSWQELIKDFADGLGYDMKESSFDELLRIPQYYYNARKEKEYYDVIYNKFNIKSEPNKIHDLILELNPAHIITTNYDDLIERAANSKGMFYDVVSKDSDLAYSVNNKMIIKMHGDLKNKNIVLKEDDYMSYFNNFKLIQNYIKSLISTHVVLFVGYSVSDVNLKYIFQWVRDVLKNNFQQAYLLECSKSFNQLEFEYYKNRGINIIYSKCPNFNYENKENDEEALNENLTIGQATEKMLKDIVYEGENNGLTLEALYNVFKPLKYLEVIRIQDIIRPLKNLTSEELLYDFRNNIIELSNTNLIEFFYDFNNEDLNYKKEFILEVLKKAKVKQIKVRKTKKQIENEILNKINDKRKSNNNEENAEDVILNINLSKDEHKEYTYLFNYKVLEEKVNKNLFKGIKGREQEALLDAYYLYKVGKFIDSYKLLKTISEHCIEKNLYYFYFISEFNRYYLGKIISSRPWVYSEDGKLVKSEYEKMDLEKVYKKLPKGFDNNIEVYKDILNFKFAYSQIKEVVSVWKNIDNERNTIYFGADLNQFPIYKLINKMKMFNNFIVGNKLCVDTYNEIKVSFYNFIDCVLFSYTLEVKEDYNDFIWIKGNIPKILEIDYFIIYTMIEYLSFDEIKLLFDKYRIENLKVSKEALEDLKKISFNLFYALNNIKFIRDIKEKTEKYLYIIKHVKVNSDILNKIIEYFTDTLENNSYMLTDTIIKEIIGLISINEFLDIKSINNLLKYILKEIKYNIKRENSNLEELILNIIINIKTFKIEFINDLDFNIIKEYIDLNKDTYVYYSILINLYLIDNEVCKGYLLAIINKKLNEKEEFNWNEFILYFLAVSKGIIKPNNLLEIKFFKFIDNEIKEKQNNEKVGRHIFKIYNLDGLLSNALALLITERILNKEYLKKYYKFNKCIEFLNENMPVNIFEVNWINRFSENINRELSKKEEFKNKVKEYLIENLDDTDTLKTYLKYYS